MKKILCILALVLSCTTNLTFLEAHPKQISIKSVNPTRERTLSIIKPDAVKNGFTGKILDRFESEGFSIIAIRKIKLSKKQAERFYAVHKKRPFFNGLVSFMASGPIIASVLERENAIAKNREIMGATDPKKAASGTIRADFAKNIQANAVHGSDSQETAKTEIAFFFTGIRLMED